jgi:hypothetical protein
MLMLARHPNRTGTARKTADFADNLGGNREAGLARSNRLAAENAGFIMNGNSLTLKLPRNGSARQTPNWVAVSSVLNSELVEKSHGPQIRKTELGHTDSSTSRFVVATALRAGAVPCPIASAETQFFEYFPL